VLRKPPEVATTMPSEYPQDCVSETNGMIGKDIPIILHANDLSETVPPNSLSNDSHDFTAKHFYAWGYYTYEVAFEGRKKTLHAVLPCQLLAIIRKRRFFELRPAGSGGVAQLEPKDNRGSLWERLLLKVQ